MNGCEPMTKQQCAPETRCAGLIRCQRAIVKSCECRPIIKQSSGGSTLLILPGLLSDVIDEWHAVDPGRLPTVVVRLASLQSYEALLDAAGAA